MPKVIINYILLFFALVIGQAILFNNLVLFNSAVALVFLYLIVELPMTIRINWLLTIAFFMGLSVDVFQDTPGLNALSCTVIAFMRRFIFHLYVPRDEEYTGHRICINSVGMSTFLKYMLTMVLIYCIMYFCLEALTYSDIHRLVERIIASSAFTFVVIFALDSLTVKRSEKRL